MVPVVIDSEKWGNLPEEVRMRLIERNVRDYTPGYMDAIRSYFKKVSTGR
jgi:hypothetical protein